jgi:uncharacterized protein (DUF433 family)
MANLDWSQCPAVESIPGKVSGASIEEVLENFHVTREQVQTVLEFAAKSAATPREAMPA